MLFPFPLGIFSPPPAVSLPGTSWTARSVPTLNSVQDGCWGNNGYVIVRSAGTNKVLFSATGASWAEYNNTVNNLYGVAYGNGIYLAVGTSGATMTSPDGTTWTNRSANPSGGMRRVSFGNGIFVALSNTSSSQVYTTTDGLSWTARSIGQLSSWMSITFANNEFIAVSYDGTKRVATSPDGVTWTLRNGPAFACYAVAYNGSRWVITGEGGNSAWSTDRITWNTVAIGAVDTFSCCIWSGSHFITTNWSGGIRASTDGSSWTARTPPVAQEIDVLCTNQSTNIVLAYYPGSPATASNQIQTSP